MTLVEICQEVADFLAMPVDVKLESISEIKSYEATRTQEKIDNLPIASDLMLEIWDSYCQLRNTKIGSELICQIIMNLSSIQVDHWCTDQVDRSPWIEVICDMLGKELSFTDPNENLMQALSTALSIEFGKNFPNAWQKFSVICDKVLLIIP